MRKKWSFLLLVGVICSGWIFSQEHKKLEYEVSVNAQIIPMFAVDSQGNPIFDLKKKELELRVNSKLSPIYLLTQYRFEYQKEIQDNQQSDNSQVPLQPSSPSPTKASKRVIFLVIDTQYQNMVSLNRDKEITSQLIRESSPHDIFVLLSYSDAYGFKYLGGLNGNKEVLLQQLKQLRIAHESPYENQTPFVRRFCQLQDALMSISGPKTLFLLSRYIPMSCALSRDLNEGGTSINTVYTGNVTSVTQRWPLRMIADLSGGMFYYKPEVNQIVKSIQKTTSAYYELVFIPKDNKIEEFNIKKGTVRWNVGILEWWNVFLKFNSTYLL